MTNFVLALIQIMEEEESTETILAIRNKALSKIAQGSGKEMIYSGVNGKSFNFQISKTADVLFAECSEAIRAYNYGIATSEEVDFSNI